VTGELDGTNAVVRTDRWGLDLSGSMEGAWRYVELPSRPMDVANHQTLRFISVLRPGWARGYRPDSSEIRYGELSQERKTDTMRYTPARPRAMGYSGDHQRRASC
jgi:hypothetical protein